MHQHRITAKMAVLVIYRLEIVQVQQDGARAGIDRLPARAAVLGAQTDAVVAGGHPAVQRVDEIDGEQADAGAARLRLPALTAVDRGQDQAVVAGDPARTRRDETDVSQQGPATDGDGLPGLAAVGRRDGRVADGPTHLRVDEIDGREIGAGAAVLRRPGRTARPKAHDPDRIDSDADAISLIDSIGTNEVIKNLNQFTSGVSKGSIRIDEEIVLSGENDIEFEFEEGTRDKYLELAVRTLHKAFGLEQDPAATGSDTP